MIPLIQREIDVFKDVVWNSHRIRAQKNTYLPDGVPEHTLIFLKPMASKIVVNEFSNASYGNCLTGYKFSCH